MKEQKEDEDEEKKKNQSAEDQGGLNVPADAIMKQYLEECLEYHEEEEAKTTAKDSLMNQSAEAYAAFVAVRKVAAGPPAFVSVGSIHNGSSQHEGGNNKDNSNNGLFVESKAAVPSHAVTNVKTKPNALAQSFLDKPVRRDMTATPAEHRARRLQYFRLEQERFQHVLLRNLDYVVAKEEQKLQRQLDDIQVAQRAEETIRQQHAALLAKRQAGMKQLKQTKAGLGTRQQKKTERFKRKHGHAVSGTPQRNDTAALYLSALPRSIEEDTVRSLFGSYGKIQKVHFYRDRQTSELKGDGLLVFGTRNETEKQSIIDAVCTQVGTRRARCGVQIRKEGSERCGSYKQRKWQSKRAKILAAS